MRFVYFVLLSSALHLGLMTLILDPRPVFPQMQVSILQVQLQALSLSSLNGSKSSVDTGSINMQTNAKPSDKTLSDDSNTGNQHNNAAETPNSKPLSNTKLANQAQTNTSEINNGSYYSPIELNRRAMLQLSLDTSTINPELSSGLPIKLRLYVNKLGRVVKIERMGVLDQDSAFAEQLEQQVYKASFLPARRNGMDVDSYMDIELSFNPLTPFEN